jgi:hypothetical protein
MHTGVNISVDRGRKGDGVKYRRDH